jgi:hypothetical protein
VLPPTSATFRPAHTSNRSRFFDSVDKRYFEIESGETLRNYPRRYGVTFYNKYSLKSQLLEPLRSFSNFACLDILLNLCDGEVACTTGDSNSVTQVMVFRQSECLFEELSVQIQTKYAAKRKISMC